MKIDSAHYTKHNDIIIIQFPYSKYDIDEMRHIFNNVSQIFPDNVVLALPDDISLSILREENPFL